MKTEPHSDALRCRLTLLSVFATLFLSIGIRAQSVSPAVVQYSASADGSFELRNDSIVALAVVLEAKSFDVSENGDVHFSPLRSDIHLDLSERSIRIPPKQKRTVYYRASADHYPAWFTIYANFAAPSRHKGVDVQMELPHTVYLLAKEASHRTDINFSAIQISGNKLHGTLQNTGSNVTRVHNLEVVLGHGKATSEGFPLFPGGKRKFEIDLPNGAEPVEIRAKLEHFHVEKSLR